MRNKKSYRVINIKLFIFIFISIGIIFILIGINTARNRTIEEYKHFEYDSVNIARGYSYSLSKASEAEEIINDLLEDKILIACKSVLLINEDYNNELLMVLAEKLEVDEINIFSSEGKILYSNISNYVGAELLPNHPAYHFGSSSELYLMEDIRKDVESDLLYKYGYYKSNEGWYVQVGVLATKIHDFLGSFEIQYLINEIGTLQNIENVYFIDNNYHIIGSTDSKLLNGEVTDPKVIEAIKQDKEWGFLVEEMDNEMYEVHIPVYVNDSKFGTLAVMQSTKKLEESIINEITIYLLFLFTIVASLATFMIMTYQRSSKQANLTFYDPLTGLPNKVYLNEYITDRITKENKNRKAILMINCINFRTINLTYGFKFGDELLKKITQKLIKISSKGKLFRFTADRFILYIENYINENELLVYVEKIENIFKDSFIINEESKFLNIQVGIVEINRHNNNVDQLLKEALIVLDQIDKDNINYGFFNDKMVENHKRKSIIENDIRKALAENDQNRIYLEFQPQLDLKTDKIVAFEALARMNSETLGQISPLEFIHIAETNQIIVEFGNYVLKSACKFIKTLNKEGYDDIRISVNVSVIQLLRDDFVDNVIRIVNEEDIDFSSLELEITESVFLDNYELVNEKLGKLRMLGINVSIDDFGTGFSSFARLRELNIDILKIDRYFITGLSKKETKKFMTPVIITIAHNLGIKVVAEGVELKEQKDYLIENDCDIMQGFLFSKPISEKEAIDLIYKVNK